MHTYTHKRRKGFGGGAGRGLHTITNRIVPSLSCHRERNCIEYNNKHILYDFSSSSSSPPLGIILLNVPHLPRCFCSCFPVRMALHRMSAVRLWAAAHEIRILKLEEWATRGRRMKRVVACRRRGRWYHQQRLLMAMLRIWLCPLSGTRINGRLYFRAAFALF